LTNKNLKISDPFTLDQIEEKYTNCILTQDFYDIDYALEWLKNNESAIDMANYINKILKPKKVVDIGCGIGKLVGELQKKNIDAYGIEFSDAFINASPVKKYIFKDNILDLDHVASGDYDLVICMEVLEHLPPTFLNKAINNVKKICKNKILITVPAFGPNKFGYSGLPLNETCWLEDARKNISFRNLVVDENNIPDLGHISLATYEWWTQKFLKNGLIRDIKCENEGYINHNFLKYHWNTFILNRLDENCINIKNHNFFFENLFDTEDWGREIGKIRWTEKRFDVWLSFTKPIHEIVIEFYSGPKEIVYERKLKIICKRLVETDEQQLQQQDICIKSYSILPDTWYKLNLPISVQLPDVIKFECELDYAFIPEYLIRNGDNRSLGIALKFLGGVS
jgi:SAM-dependent methyltransferase